MYEVVVRQRWFYTTLWQECVSHRRCRQWNYFLEKVKYFNL